MVQQTINSKDLNLEKLFEDFYLIPDYQREYVWQSKQIEQLLNDIHSEFPEQRIQHKADEYFIGSIVVCPSNDDNDRLYEVIDGQQRITTAYIFLCVIKNYILKLKSDTSVNTLKNLLVSTTLNSQGLDEERCRVSLQYTDNSSLLKKFTEDSFEPEIIKLENVSKNNLINCYQTIRSFLEREFKENLSEIQRFSLHFIRKVKLVRVETGDVNHALRVFETINDRGIGLNPMDLLKNLLFKQVELEKIKFVSKKWKGIITTLERCKEKPFNFLRYFIFSHYDATRDEAQSKIYEWFFTHKELCEYEVKPIEFVDKIEKAAKAYSNFIHGKNKNNKESRYLKNIKKLAPTARQHMTLLLAGMHLPEDKFEKLCYHLENLFFVHIITKQKMSELERNFLQWASALRKTDEESFDEFISQNIIFEKNKHIKQFEEYFLKLSQSDLPGYRIKYVLAKLTQYIQEQAYKGDTTYSELNNFLKTKVEVEHILPQTPTEDIKKLFDKPEEIKKYTQRLGNLLLLEKPLNSSLGNKPFNEKKAVYKQSMFLLTKSISEKPKIGNTAIDKACEDLLEFDEWSSHSIEEQQKLFTNMAKKIWDMEEDEYEDDPFMEFDF